MMALDLETARRELLGPGRRPSYSPSGHILYEAEQPSSIWALPFSLETGKPAGEAFPVVRDGTRHSVAEDGTLVYFYRPGGGRQQLGGRDRRGGELGKIGQPQTAIALPALSPDGRFVAVRDVEPDVEQDVWIHDIARSLTTRLTLSPSDDSRPFWSPASKQVVFWSDRNGNADVFIKPADGSGEAKVVLTAPSTEYPTDWSPDGKVILVERISRQTSIDLWYVKLQENSEAPKAVPYLQTAANERVGKFSPQGRYVV